MTTRTTTTQTMQGRTMSMTSGMNPLRQNPLIAAVHQLRAAQENPALLPNGGRVRESGRRRVDALIASGLYDPVHA